MADTASSLYLVVCRAREYVEEKKNRDRVQAAA